jgi:hypothetical protein
MRAVPEGFGRVRVRSRFRDWSPLVFDADPTPGNVDAVVAWMSSLQAQSEWCRVRADLVNEVLGLVDVSVWSGLAADAVRGRLRLAVDGARVASTRHGEAGVVAQAWAEALFSAQYAADQALHAAEAAERDIAVLQAAISALAGDHAGLLDQLDVLQRASSSEHQPTGTELFAARERDEELQEELARSRHRLEDAEWRLAQARANGQDAQREHEGAEAVFVRGLEAARTGAIAHSTVPELTVFGSGVGRLAVIDVAARPTGVALMTLLHQLTPAELTLLLADNPALVPQFWDNPPNPEVVAGWWNGLTPAVQAALLSTAPALFGNLPGMPYKDRNTANRLSLAEARKNPDLTADRRAVLDKMESALDAPADGVPVQLVAFNFFSEPPMVTVGYGDLDTCQNTTWCVGGMDFGAKDALAGWSDAARNLYLAQTRLGVDQPGVIACLEYDNPDLVGVNNSAAAKKGAPRFAAELDGNAATRDVFGSGAAPITVTAHSYGSTMAAIALTQTHIRVDAFVMVGSAGLVTSEVPSLAALHANHVYTTAATADQLAPFGASVSGRAEPNPDVAYPGTRTIGGAEAFSSDGDGKHLERVDGHNPLGKEGAISNSGFLNAVPSEGHGYYDRKTQSLNNIAATTTGQPGKVSGGLSDTTPAADRHNLAEPAIPYFQS